MEVFWEDGQRMQEQGKERYLCTDAVLDVHYVGCRRIIFRVIDQTDGSLRIDSQHGQVSMEPLSYRDRSAEYFSISDEGRRRCLL